MAPYYTYWLATYDFLLVICNDFRSTWIRCRVISRQNQQTVIPARITATTTRRSRTMLWLIRWSVFARRDAAIKTTTKYLEKIKDLSEMPVIWSVSVVLGLAGGVGGGWVVCTHRQTNTKVNRSNRRQQTSSRPCQQVVTSWQRLYDDQTKRRCPLANVFETGV